MPTYYYAYIPLSSELEAIILDHRRQFPSTARRNAPHLTVLVPCCIRDGKSALDLLRSFAAGCKEAYPFATKTSSVGYFGNKWNVHFEIEESAGLRHLIKSIGERMEETVIFRNPNFAAIPNPHITICDKIAPGQGEELFTRVRAEFVSKEILCQQVCLVRRSEGEAEWNTVEVFNLA